MHKIIRNLFTERQRIELLMWGMRFKSLAYIGDTFTAIAATKLSANFFHTGTSHDRTPFVRGAIRWRGPVFCFATSKGKPQFSLLGRKSSILPPSG